MKRTLLLVLAIAGCDDERVRVNRGSSESEAAAPAAAAVDGGVHGTLEPASYRDEDFVEADTNRDPFRNYAGMFQVAIPTAARQPGDENWVMPETGVEEMRLIGIISGVADPRAMLVDSAGVGYTVRRGAYVGRAEVVQAGGAAEMPVPLRWRVERIRDNEVVLTREDPTAPSRPPLTRVIPLREEQAEGSVRPVPR